MAQGYQIKVKLNPVEAQYLYLIDNQFSKKHVLDTCRLKPAKKDAPINALFKSNTEIPFGLYTLECNGKVLATLALGGKETCIFQLDLTTENQMSPHAPSLPLKPIYNAAITESIQKYELSSHHIKINPIPQEYQHPDFQFITDSARFRYRDSIFEYCILNDENLLHTPLDYDKRLFFYFTKCVKPEADSLKQAIEGLLEQAGSSAALQKYYLNMLLSLFRDADHAYDEVVVFIFEKYCPEGTCPWLDPTWNRIFKNRVARVNKLIKGATLPALEAYDMDEKLISTDSLHYKNIVLWFWDPDCDHCLEETPKLFQKYEKLKAKYDLEVYAISITDDLPRWKAFIEKHSLDWLNVSYGMGTPNYDFIDYFDLLITPAIYLIDSEHRIVAHSFNVLDLEKMLK
jgi:peroxiredoxin